MRDLLWFPVIYMLGFSLVYSLAEIAATTLQIFKLVVFRKNGLVTAKCYDYLYLAIGKYAAYGVTCWLMPWIFFKWHSDSKISISLGLIGGLFAVKNIFRNSKDEFYEQIKDSIKPNKTEQNLKTSKHPPQK